MKSIIERLPKAFQNDLVLKTMAEHFKDYQIMFSSVIYRDNGKDYIINKGEQTPYFEKDWQCYSLLRCLSDTLITTGSIIRQEKGLFQSNACFGDKQIQEMYENLRGGRRQNVYVMTHTMISEQLSPLLNKDFYELIDTSQVNKSSESSKEQKEVELHDILKYVLSVKKTPVLIEAGPTVLKKYYMKIKQQAKNDLIQGAYIAIFEGVLEKPSIGKEFSFEFDLYDLAWQSEKMDIHQNGKKIGTLYFQVYHKKK